MALKQVLHINAGQELDLNVEPKTFNTIPINGRVISFIQPLTTTYAVQARYKGNTTGLKQDRALGGIYNKANRAFDVSVLGAAFGSWDKVYCHIGQIEVHLED